MNILIVDDEKEIIELIELYLTKENYRIFKANDGIEAVNILNKEDIKLAVIDIMMPKMNGLSLIKHIRENKNFPIIIISAMDQFSDRILGLEIGADDYVTKPFNPLELVARIKAQLRRYSSLKGDASVKDEMEIVDLGGLIVDQNQCLVMKNGQVIELTLKEYKILECLIQSIGRVYSKKQVYEYAWEENYYNDENVLRIHVSNLRDKIEEDSKSPKYIKTVRGLGYKVDRYEEK